MAVTILFLSFALLLAIGVPVAYALAASALATLFCSRAWLSRLPGGTSCVSQTLPPISDPAPIVTRPRIVAPA